MTSFFLSFSLPPHQVKQIHKSYCTEVLQSANIMNWHKLVYTLHFLDGKQKRSQSKGSLCLSSPAPSLVTLRSCRTESPLTSSPLHSHTRPLSQTHTRRHTHHLLILFSVNQKITSCFVHKTAIFPTGAVLHHQKLLIP